MNPVFNGEWWTVRLPGTWQGQPEEHGASFFRTPRRGTLQISAAQKGAAQVLDEDLREFAGERLAKGQHFRRIRYSNFAGFHCFRKDDDFFWHEWWLRNGPTMVYATYVVPMNDASEDERNEVEEILESLAAR